MSLITLREPEHQPRKQRGRRWVIVVIVAASVAVGITVGREAGVIGGIQAGIACAGSLSALDAAARGAWRQQRGPNIGMNDEASSSTDGAEEAGQ